MGELRLERVAQPVIGARDVLVRVHAAGVDRGAWHLLTGRPYLVRLAGFGLRHPKQPILGSEFAGEIVTVGSAVTRFAVGDRVFGAAEGAFAEFVAAPQTQIALRPEALTVTQAAAMPVSAVTALKALDLAATRRGERALILGASGGVGTFAVQVARALDIRVTAVCSAAKADLVRSLGADVVLDYADGSLGPERYEAILDLAGNRPLAELRRRLTDRGTLVIVGGEGGGRLLGGTQRQVRAMMLSRFTRQRLRAFIATTHTEDLERLVDLVDRQALTPVVEQTYTLDEAPRAISDLDAGRVRGKVVITL